jgi:hypothetical protein
MMMVEIAQRWFVTSTYIHNRYIRVGQVRGSWFATLDRRGALRNENARGKKVVFVRAPGVRHDELNHPRNLDEMRDACKRIQPPRTTQPSRNTKTTANQS